MEAESVESLSSDKEEEVMQSQTHEQGEKSLSVSNLQEHLVKQVSDQTYNVPIPKLVQSPNVFNQTNQTIKQNKRKRIKIISVISAIFILSAIIIWLFVTSSSSSSSSSTTPSPSISLSSNISNTTTNNAV